MASFSPIPPHSPRLADHSADWTMLPLAAGGLVTGTAGVLAAWLLLRLIALATNLAWYGHFSVAPSGMIAAHGWRVVLIPVLGSVAVGLMARFGSEKIRGHGIPEAIEAILFGESRLSLKVAVLKPLSSAISIGTGGPFGAEGPIIMTGGAIGSLFAQCFHLSAAERKTLLVAGAAAGMTAIFGTPLAAVLLAVEVLLFEWKPRSLVPVAASAITAAAWRPLLIGAGPMFPFTGALPGAWWVLPLAAGLGTVVGLAAAALSSGLYRVEDAFHRLPIHWMWWPALGGLIVGLGGLIEPRVLGAGYGNIADLLAGSLVVQAIVLLLVVKAVVWTVALGSGTSGGVLAPLLILGGAMGGLIGHWLPGSDGAWALIGMAGIMAAAMRAPLTGAIFAVELTGRLDALPATLAAAGAGYALAVLLLRRSILTEKIARRGRHIQQEFAVDPWAVARVGEIMTQAPETLPATMRIADTLAFFEAEARHRCYPVIDGGGRPVGLITRADALRWHASDAVPDMLLGETVSDRALMLAVPGMTLAVLADLMAREDIGRVPVVDPADGRLVGLVARADLLKVRLRHQREESHREGFWPARTSAPARARAPA